LDGTEREPGDGAHHGQLADAGAISDHPGASEQADTHGRRGCRDPGQQVTEQAAGDQPLAGADDRARDQANGQRCDGIIDPADGGLGRDPGDREADEAGDPQQPAPDRRFGWRSVETRPEIAWRCGAQPLGPAVPGPVAAAGRRQTVEYRPKRSCQ
jgi:hypothetical protein